MQHTKLLKDKVHKETEQQASTSTLNLRAANTPNKAIRDWRVTEIPSYTDKRQEERERDERKQSSKQVWKNKELENHVENEWTRAQPTTQKTGGSGKHF